MSDKNAFGGGRANSLYVPMTEVEQEALSRLVESGNLRINIVGWGYVDSPRIVFGDARLSLFFQMNFDRPEVPMDVYYFDLELATHSGQRLFAQRQSVVYDGHPIRISAGVFLDLVWDIAIQHMDPRLVKSLVPGALGLTSRLQDRDTGDITLTGNMALSSDKKAMLAKLRAGEASVRTDNTIKAINATKKSQ